MDVIEISWSAGPPVLPTAFLVVAGFGTLLVDIGTTLGSRLFEPLVVASTTHPGGRSIALPRPRLPVCPLGRPPSATLSSADMSFDP
jgi:hypothetical protein